MGRLSPWGWLASPRAWVVLFGAGSLFVVAAVWSLSFFVRGSGAALGYFRVALFASGIAPSLSGLDRPLRAHPPFWSFRSSVGPSVRGNTPWWGCPPRALCFLALFAPVLPADLPPFGVRSFASGIPVFKSRVHVDSRP